MPGEGAKFFATRNIPKLARLIIARTRKRAATRGKGNRIDRKRMPGNDASLPAARYIPQLERAVIARARKHAAVRGKGYRSDTACMPGEGVKLPAARGIPKLKRLIPACARNLAAVREKSDREDSARMPREAANQPPRSVLWLACWHTLFRRVFAGLDGSNRLILWLLGLWGFFHRLRPRDLLLRLRF